MQHNHDTVEEGHKETTVVEDCLEEKEVRFTLLSKSNGLFTRTSTGSSRLKGTFSQLNNTPTGTTTIRKDKTFPGKLESPNIGPRNVGNSEGLGTTPCRHAISSKGAKGNSHARNTEKHSEQSDPDYAREGCHKTGRTGGGTVLVNHI